MRIGIIGAGQLGQMLGYAAIALGHKPFFLDPSAAPPAAAVGPVIQARFDDAVALAILAEKCDVVTYEFENVPLSALETVAEFAPVRPTPDALKHAQDRLCEKRLFESLEIPIPEYRPVDSLDDLEAAAASIGLPLVVKTRRMGYDGKGQYVLRHVDQIAEAWQQLRSDSLIAEQWIKFDYEVSAIGVRTSTGVAVSYCLTRNEHSGGILQTSLAPVADDALTETASRHLHRLLESLDYVGVLALELFVVGGTVFANEFAPRVHNSGHWTIEGAETSQFSNHIRAITGEPLGSTENRGHAGMINLIGTIPEAARQQSAGSLHDYGKKPRPGRKLGHITIVAGSSTERDRMIREMADSVTSSTGQPGTAT